jgi:hypothetical protein
MREIRMSGSLTAAQPVREAGRSMRERVGESR